MATYSHITRLQLENMLAARLGDTSKVFFVAAELQQYISEALCVWNCLAQYSRDRGTFNTTAGVAFYDINSMLVNNSVMILKQSMTDSNLLVDIKCNLMEDTQTLAPTSWGGTDQFTLQDVQDALEKARNEFLLKTSNTLSFTTLGVGAGSSGRISLADTIIDIIRASYLPATGGTYYQLERADERTYNQFIPNWNLNPDQPTGYSVFLTPYVQLQLMPIPATNGTLSLVLQQSGAALDLTTGVILGVPNDQAWIVKYGALASLYAKEGQANDPFRAEYCQQRFEQGIAAASLASTVQQSLLNELNLVPSTFDELDLYTPDWQSTSGQPTSIAINKNIIALSPVPNAIYGITLDVVRNIPLPTADGSFIQVGREHISTLLDYCVHLAMLKVGGQEFQNTLPLFKNMLELAAEHNQRLKSMGGNFDLFRLGSNKQQAEVPLKVVTAATQL